MSEKRTTTKAGNLFGAIPSDLAEEVFTTLHQAEGLRIERIVSHGHASPPGFWYNQNEHEWVIVLKGSAAIQFEGDPDSVELQPGAYLNIPAHARHRVVSTHPTEDTVWLAIYYGA
jgi:cupin 2 domain-containing protein